MKILTATACACLGLLVSWHPASAQPWRGYEPSYRERDHGDYYERRPSYRQRGAYEFDERSYLRCNPDVRGAVYRGEQESGYEHYRNYGRFERRRLRC